MIVRRFLQWVDTAPPDQRAEAVNALARAYLYSDLPDQERREAEAAITVMLDDPSPLVRQAIAEALASSPDAPRPVIVALAAERSDVASLVLASSPVLTDSDLVDAVALGDEQAQVAIASRPKLSASVSGALAEVGTCRAVIALLGNTEASVASVSLSRILERYGDQAEVRDALLLRPNLTVELRHAITIRALVSAGTLDDDGGWLHPERLEQVIRDAREKAAVSLAFQSDVADVQRLVRYLRVTGQLTPALLLRALLSRCTVLVEAALAELTGHSLSRVSGLLHDWRGNGFAALYDKAGLPISLKAAFASAVAALREAPMEDSHGLSRRMIERVLTACEHLEHGNTGFVISLLRRYEAESAREDARALMSRLRRRAAPESVLDLSADDLVPAPVEVAFIQHMKQAA